ncbi:MAG: VCBS repeat-containing protein, partial [Flavobacteriales bacterium]|nr:VCBS repeat-containing protein [Flavobacteriales bacterium]
MKNSRLKNPFPSQTFSFKFFRILLLLFLIVPELQGQFVRRFELTESTYIPVDVRTADINDDGLMDILTASSEDDKFAWFQNLGNGSFKQHVLTDQGNNAKSIYEVDLDNDGDLDILTAANSDTKVSWFENLGQNQFGPRQVVAILAGLLRAEPGDMDNDGDMDIVIASYNRLRWLKNQGNGVFGGLNTIRTEWIGTNDFEVFDINNDGFDDVIECTSGSSVKYYENNGTGFSSTTLTSGGYIRTKVADINSDGHMDILAAASGNTFKWFRNNGNGFFDTTLTITNGASGLRDIEFVDFDLDGDQDLVYCTANGQVHQLINDSGSFSIGPFILSHNGRAICADDIAGDIFPEIICARDQSTTEWIERDSVGDYSIKHSLNRNSSPTDAIFFLDLNNDNKVEIISGTNGSAGYSFYGMRYFENLDNLEFGGLESANFQGLSGSNIQWEDMDGDGLLDVFYCKESLSYTNDQLRWQKNLGNGNFGSDSVINFYSKNSKKMRFSDIDKDGDRDLAVMTGHLGEIVWLENDGGLSTPHIIDSNKIGLNFIGFQDLNQDSLEDLVAIRWNQGISKILLYQNLNGTFSNALIIADSLPYVYTVDFSDINNDGYMDIVGAGDGSNNVFWLENDSSGSFFTKHSLTVSLAGQIVKQGVFDVDNDMDDDIIVLSQWDDEVMLFRNNGDGTFQPKEVISNEIDKPQYKPSHFDLDYDGDLDFVIGARLGRIHCFENSFNTRDSILQTICLGDSFLVGNQYFNTPGYYVDSSATQFGGDSVTVFE